MARKTVSKKDMACNKPKATSVSPEKVSHCEGLRGRQGKNYPFRATRKESRDGDGDGWQTKGGGIGNDESQAQELQGPTCEEHLQGQDVSGVLGR